MIGTTLSFITNQLDSVLHRRLKLPPSERKIILSPFVDLSGGVAVKEENTLVLSRLISKRILLQLPEFLPRR